jgi:hypothetical protein
MAELFEAVASWRTLLVVLLVFGVAPGLVLRLIVLLYPKGHPRRKELVAELYVVPRWERPLFVAEQLEVGLTEALPTRIKAVRGRRAMLMQSLDELDRRRLRRVRACMWTLLACVPLHVAFLVTGVADREALPAWGIGFGPMALAWLTDLIVVRRRATIRAAHGRLEHWVMSRKQ